MSTEHEKNSTLLNASNLSEALRECLAWVDANDGRLVFEPGGAVSLFDARDLRGSVDRLTSRNGAEVLNELLAEAQTPPPTESPLPAAAFPEITWFGLGEHHFAWDERRILLASPAVDFMPRAFRCASSVGGYRIHQMRIAGVPLLIEGSGGIPMALFAETAIAPQMLFPCIGPNRPIEFEIQAPACPKAPAPFCGALYGDPKGNGTR